METYKERNFPDDKVDRSLRYSKFLPGVNLTQWVRAGLQPEIDS